MHCVLPCQPAGQGGPVGMRPPMLQFSCPHPCPSPCQADKAAIDQEAALLAFDRANHMGASDALTQKLKETISEEAEVRAMEGPAGRLWWLALRSIMGAP